MFLDLKTKHPKNKKKNNAVLMYAQALQHPDSTHACLAAMTSKKG